ncbi:S1C family serine protease [Candidatus Poriferisodalis sp.]|uniref:S1C family serine protease n=1 Tax=Candidatus Poriferisodalis sp. TaxID=3101277 RepID=UPI003B02CCA4
MAETDRPPVEPEEHATASPVVELHELSAAAPESSQAGGLVPELPTAQPGAQLPAELAGAPPQRRGCLLIGLAAVIGAAAGAVVAGLILVIVLSGDDGGPLRGDGVADSGAVLPSGDDLGPAAVPAEVTPPEGSTGDSDFWSQVLADSDLFSGITSGESGTQSGDGELDLSPGVLADVWARMLTGESDEPGAPLGSRIEGINVKAVLEEVQESVVIVKTPTEESPDGGGSGFVVASDGHIVTNEHVVRDAELVQVRLFGGELLPAEVVASDPTRDLAVLKIDRAGLQAVRLGSSEGVEVGDEVIAIGNAFGIDGEPTVTAGIVSGLNRHIDFPDRRRLVRLIQTDAAINPGNSGGPLVNAAGEVIGVNTAIRSGFAEGIGYAISIDHARPIIDQLLEGVVQAKAYLGVRIASVSELLAAQEQAEAEEPDPLDELGDGRPETVEPGSDTGTVELDDIDVPPEVTSGAYVVSVEAGHAAQRAGIVPGDVIVSFEGVPIRTRDELVLEILARVPGDLVSMGVIGLDGRVRTVELVLGSFPNE